MAKKELCNRDIFESALSIHRFCDGPFNSNTFKYLKALKKELK